MKVLKEEHQHLLCRSPHCVRWGAALRWGTLRVLERSFVPERLQEKPLHRMDLPCTTAHSMLCSCCHSSEEALTFWRLFLSEHEFRGDYETLSCRTLICELKNQEIPKTCWRFRNFFLIFLINSNRLSCNKLGKIFISWYSLRSIVLCFCTTLYTLQCM